MLFVWRDFVSVYKQTILGPLWYLIQPLLTTITFTVIFGRIARLPTDGLPQMLFYMSGTVIWGYFAACLTKTSNTFVANAGIFGKVYFPRLTVPLSILISNLVALAIQLGLFLAFLAYFWVAGAAVQPNWWALLTPVLVLMMAGLGLGFGITVSSLTTRYRDLQYLVTTSIGSVQGSRFSPALRPPPRARSRSRGARPACWRPALSLTKGGHGLPS